MAMGISGQRRAIDGLIAVMLDSGAGRTLCGTESVDLRTRTFAAWGIALLCQRSDDVRLQLRALAGLQTALLDETGDALDLRVAIVHALGRLPVDAGSEKGRARAVHRLEMLEAVAVDEDESPLVRAHASAAVATMLSSAGAGPGVDDFRASFRKAWLTALTDGKAGSADQRAAVLAPGGGGGQGAAG
ncbi:MAG: hypothetical protein VX913_02780 [Planctomycetota bacterium]|nr:hypothetical protein [Planctomycetota bacterium]